MAINIIVEDGTGLINSNSYNSVSEFLAFCESRNELTINDTNAPYLLIRAMDYIESHEFFGIKTKKEQACAFPRAVYSYGGTRNDYRESDIGLVDGYPVLSNEVPVRVKKAHMLTAIAINSGFDPTTPIDRATTQETIGPLTFKYSDTSKDSEEEPFKLPIIEELLEPLICNSDIGNGVVTLVRS